MNLTAEQWRELDEAERWLAAIKAEISAAIAAGNIPQVGSGLDVAAARESFQFDVLLRRHARALIDAARPECEACHGQGQVGWERALPGGSIGEVAVTCGDCNGTGDCS